MSNRTKPYFSDLQRIISFQACGGGSLADSINLLQKKKTGPLQMLSATNR